MEIIKATSISDAPSEVSLRNSVAGLEARINTRAGVSHPVETRDTVQTSQSSLVQTVLDSRDEKTEFLVVQLREQYQSGAYRTDPVKVAQTIVAGVLSGD